MIYNEWGAIIQHQDEMDKAIKEQEQHRNKNIQDRYRQDLEMQRALIAKKKFADKLNDQ